MAVKNCNNLACHCMFQTLIKQHITRGKQRFRDTQTTMNLASSWRLDQYSKEAELIITICYLTVLFYYVWSMISEWSDQWSLYKKQGEITLCVLTVDCVYKIWLFGVLSLDVRPPCIQFQPDRRIFRGGPVDYPTWSATHVLTHLTIAWHLLQ